MLFSEKRGKMKLIFLICLAAFVFDIVSTNKGLEREPASTIESSLMTLLLTNYSVNSRPITSSVKPIVVNFDVKLGKLVALDIKNQVMVANTRVMMKWYDPSLKWNKKFHNGTEYLNIPNSLVWTPDIMLHNTAIRESQGKSDIYKAHVLVKNNGFVMWMSPVTVQASCSINLKWFPFDKQTCKLTFGSISYTKKKLKIDFFKQNRSFSEMKAKFFYSSGQWTMTSIGHSLQEVTYECCKDPFSLIDYTFNWTRLSTYWLLYLVLPCVCLAFLAVFTFFIPAETGERTGFAITTVLAMSVYLLVISDKMPEKSDESPLIGVLYIVLFFLMTAVLLSVIITTSLAFKRTKPPAFLRRYLKLDKKDHCNKTDVIPMKATGNHNEAGQTDEDVAEDMQDIRFRNPSKRRTLRRTFSIMSKDEEKELENQEEWQIIAAKIDRVLFWIYLALTIIGPSVVIISYTG